MASSPCPQRLPARRVHCRLTSVPLLRPITCLDHPLLRRLRRALIDIENWQGFATIILAPHDYPHHMKQSIVTALLTLNGWFADHLLPRVAFLGSHGWPRMLVPQMHAGPAARSRPSGCPPCNVVCAPTSWRPCSSPTALVASRSGGPPPNSRPRHPAPASPVRRGVKHHHPPTLLPPPGLFGPLFLRV